MLVDVKDSALLVIDVQSRLLGGIHQSEALVQKCAALITLAQALDVPVLGSEQYPQGLGHSADALVALMGQEAFTGKTVFSCADSDEFCRRLALTGKSSVILCGMEAQACIVESAFGFLAQGKTVYVVADAISARNPQETEWACQRMRQAGIHIISAEMLGFEWVRDASHPQFKLFSKLLLR
ncbi:MAG: isochorismatase family protein [Neisseriaceae bacterium]|nr:isochorismatase family protein [Neisseriaceae bacterium]